MSCFQHPPGNWGPEKISNLHEVIELVGGEAGGQAQVVSFRVYLFNHYEKALCKQQWTGRAQDRWFSTILRNPVEFLYSL